jgi:hypothetical protein
MLVANIRLATDHDRAHLLKAVADEQDNERALHATRRPGAEIAESYLAHIRAKIAQNQGALLNAELNGVFAGSSTMATPPRPMIRNVVSGGRGS